MKTWQTKRLGDLFVFKNGRAFKKEEWATHGLPIIRIQNLNNVDAPFNYFAGEYSRDILIEPGDLLFSWSGTVGSSFGSHLWDREPGVLNQHIFKIGLRDNLDKRYAFHALRQITAAIEESVNGAVGLVHITKEKLNGFTIPVPPLSEQQRIVGVLDEAFAGLATAEAHAAQNLQNARALFESHLQAVFTQRGPGWVETTIGEQLTLQRGFDITKDQQNTGQVPVVSSGGIKSYHDKAMANGPGVVIGRKGTLGKVFYLESAYWPHDTTLWVKDFKGNEPRFVYYLFAGLDVKKLDSGAANPALNRNQVHPIEITWPPVSQQKALVEKLDALSAETQRLAGLYERKRAALEELKKSLLHQAFAGEL